MDFPYSYISCPCKDVSVPVQNAQSAAIEETDEDQERTFDPRSPRANFSLYPLDHLLFCEDCQQIRCPRCTVEEIVCWYCPSCLFEMPASMVKGESARCNRNCYNCPLCLSLLTVSSVTPSSASTVPQGPFVLTCGYCDWTSLQIGWQFEKPTGIRSQVTKLSLDEPIHGSSSAGTPTSPQDSKDKIAVAPVTTFAALQTFYKSQLSMSTNNTDPLGSPSSFNYDSPSSLARIMSLYTGRGNYGKKDPLRSGQMRESADTSEGLHVFDPAIEREIIEKMQTSAWSDLASPTQKAVQPQKPRFVADLRPQQVLLRTKRSKRCRTCRHILVKPESKVQSTRFKIKLVALNYIPTLSIKPLQPTPSLKLPNISLESIPPMRPTQYLLTLRNPLFDLVKVALATPARTPGIFAHRVTILCPEFELGANVDQWDEALSSSKERRQSKHLNLTKTEFAGGEGGKVAEAGKVWEKGRNWTTIVMEIVCAQNDRSPEELDEDDDIVEIPLFIRLEWEADADTNVEGSGRVGNGREKKELAYWTVLGIGRIGRL